MPSTPSTITLSAYNGNIPVDVTYSTPCRCSPGIVAGIGPNKGIGEAPMPSRLHPGLPTRGQKQSSFYAVFKMALP